MWCHGCVEEGRGGAGDALPTGDLRVSDADRNRVIERLRVSAAEGRLSLEEFEDRVTEVYAAKTGDGLRHALRQLPPAPVDAREGRRAGRRPGGRPAFFPAVLVLVVVAIAVVLLTPAPFFLVPLVFWVAVVFTGRRRGRTGWARHR